VFKLTKKQFCLILAFFLLGLFLTGCAVREDSTEDGAQPQQSLSTPVDFDLTSMSETMISSLVVNMHADRGSYIGKNVKAKGVHNAMYFEVTDRFYHYVITKDGDECCQEGFEFILSSDYFGSDDYPPIGVVIEIIGVFDIYKELGHTYSHLVVNEMLVLG
jgi:hypothetical protein